MGGGADFWGGTFQVEATASGSPSAVGGWGFSFYFALFSARMGHCRGRTSGFKGVSLAAVLRGDREGSMARHKVCIIVSLTLTLMGSYVYINALFFYVNGIVL